MPSRTPRIDQPVTLRHIRGHGCRCVLVYCSNSFRCGHSATLNVDALPDDTIVRALGARMACTACGHIGADVRPDWTPHTNRYGFGGSPT